MSKKQLSRGLQGKPGSLISWEGDQNATFIPPSSTLVSAASVKADQQLFKMVSQYESCIWRRPSSLLGTPRSQSGRQ